MRKLALAAASIAIVLWPTAASAAPRIDRDCVIAAVKAVDRAALVTCLHGGPTTNAIDWD